MTNLISTKDQAVLDFITEKLMQTLSLQNQTVRPFARKISNEMRAALLIFNADPYLMSAVEPFIEVENDIIKWSVILKLPLGAGHKAAVLWAYAVWTDDQPERGECFDMAHSMSSHLKIAVLEALCLRWGLRG
jgi:hypothetical protein